MIDQEFLKTTFWGNKKDAEVKELDKEIPAMGKVLLKNRPALERWRKLQNAYYRFYNDGDAVGGKLNRMFKKYGIECPYSWQGETYQAKQLEELADIVFAEAMEEKS